MLTKGMDLKEGLRNYQFDVIEDITSFRCAPNGYLATGYKLGNFNNID